MALDPQRRARRNFWWALLSLPVTVAVFFAVVALRGDLPEDWLVWIMIGLALVFLLGLILVVWSLLFRRSKTGFPRWSIAFGMLGLLLVLAVALAPFGRLRTHEEAASESVPPPTEIESVPPPPTESKSTPPPPSNAVTVDDLLSKMSSAPVAFNVPRAMQLEDTAEVKLILGPGHDLKDLIATLNKGAEGADIKITDRMEAHLTGTGFQITPATPELQAVSQSDITSWQWDVKATESGHHQLHLTLNAILNVSSAPTSRAMRTFDRTIDVNVTFGRRLADFGRGNWQWLWATLLVPVCGWFMKKRSEARRLSRSPGRR
jgi:hypothetical protein